MKKIYSCLLILVINFNCVHATNYDKCIEDTTAEANRLSEERFQTAMREYEAAYKINKMNIESLSACLGELSDFKLPNLLKLATPNFDSIKQKVCGYVRNQVGKVTDSVQDIVDKAANDIINNPMGNINNKINNFPQDIKTNKVTKVIDKTTNRIQENQEKISKKINDKNENTIFNIWSK